MAAAEDNVPMLVGVAVALLAVIATFAFMLKGGSPPEPELEPEPPAAKPRNTGKQPKTKKAAAPAKSKAVQSHPLKWLSSKAHAPGVTSVQFSNNGMILATTGMDNTVKLFTDFDKDASKVQPKVIHIKATTSSGGMEYPDSALHASFGNKGKYLLTALAQSKHLCAYYLPGVLKKAKGEADDDSQVRRRAAAPPPTMPRGSVEANISSLDAASRRPSSAALLSRSPPATRRLPPRAAADVPARARPRRICRVKARSRPTSPGSGTRGRAALRWSAWPALSCRW